MEKDENGIALNDKFLNTPNIVIDEFTGSKIIKWKTIGYNEIVERLGIETTSLDDKILFEFSFNNIDKKDYIVFSFISNDLKL